MFPVAPHSLIHQPSTLNTQPSTPIPRTPNPEPQTPNSKPQSANPKSQTPDPRPQTPQPHAAPSKTQTPTSTPQTSNPTPQTPNPKLRTRRAEDETLKTNPNLFERSKRLGFVCLSRSGVWGSGVRGSGFGVYRGHLWIRVLSDVRLAPSSALDLQQGYLAYKRQSLPRTLR